MKDVAALDTPADGAIPARFSATVSLGYEDYLHAHRYRPEMRPLFVISVPACVVLIGLGLVGGFFGFPTGLLYLTALYLIAQRVTARVVAARQVAALPPAARWLRVELSEEGIKLASPGAPAGQGETQLSWSELESFSDCPRSVLLHKGRSFLVLPKRSFEPGLSAFVMRQLRARRAGWLHALRLTLWLLAVLAFVSVWRGWF